MHCNIFLIVYSHRNMNHYQGNKLKMLSKVFRFICCGSNVHMINMYYLTV